MIDGKRVVVVMPAYNAEKTLLETYQEIPLEVVDLVIVGDDASTDATTELARELGLELFEHPENLGYGANQKTCYREALRHGADIVVMLHPDYQYSPRLVLPMPRWWRAATSISYSAPGSSVPARSRAACP